MITLNKLGRFALKCAAACLLLSWAPVFADPVILFDDLVAPSTTVAPIVPGYHGLAWTGLEVLDGVDFSFHPSGYQAGVVSPKNVVYTSFGDPFSSQNGSMSGGLFDLVSAYLTAALNDGLNVQALGYINGSLVYSNNYVINSTTPTLIPFNFYGVTEVDFITSGGSANPGYGLGFDEGFVMDNVNVHVYVPYSQAVQNGGFETGDFTGWSLIGNTNGCLVTSNAFYVHSGAFGAELGPGVSPGELSQTAFTGTTASYQLSFWLENFDNIENEFGIYWEGGTLLYQTNVATLPWVNPQYTVTSFKPRSSLQFTFVNTPSYFGLDDIAVTPIPMPYNGGFESGFAGWTLSGNITNLAVFQNPGYVRTGTNGAGFGSVGSPGYISQKLPTFPGQSYLVSFWLGSPSTNALNNEFSASWNGQTLFNQTNLAVAGWTNLHFTVLATNSQTTLEFGGRNDPAYFALDEITVTPVPLVVNGGFETGDFTGWTSSGNSNDFYVTTATNFISSGSYGAQMGPVGAPGYLSQSIPTVPGQTYLLSCWFDNPTGDTPNDFQINWAGANLLNLTNWSVTGWINPQFFVTAKSTTTPLQFGFSDNPAYLGLDEVTVQPFPAPDFISQVATNGVIEFTFVTVPGYQYQVQYSLDLKNWNNLGLSEYATSDTTTGYDPLGPDPHRFYRVILMQPVFIF